MKDEVKLPLWLQFLLLFSFLFLLIEKIRARKHSKKVLSGPPKLPIIGNLHQLGPLAHRSLHQLSKKYGPVMLLQIGSVPTLVVSSADAARKILTTNDLDCCSRPLLAGAGRLSYNYLDVAFTPYGSYWREMRKICNHELFSAKRVQSFQFIREEEIGLMIESISQSSSSESPVNLTQKMMSLTMDLICRVAFGKSSKDRELDHNKLHELIHEALGIMGSFFASDFFPYVGWIIDRIRGLHGRIERVFQDLDLFYQMLIDDHLRTGRQKQEAEDIIDVLLQIKKYQTNTSLQITQDHIKGILMNILFAGVDTTSALVVWAMAELVRNPILMKKAQDEIRNCVAEKGRVSECDIHQFQYLKMVIKETLRLHPPGALLLPRECISQFNINGYSVCPKTHIQVNIWAIGRDPESWENPDQFNPERFMDSPIDFKGRNFELLPFGAGRRSCPGMNMGILNVELALANLLYHFDWKLPNALKAEDLNMEEAAGLTNYKKEALVLIPTKYH
ncbi:cytochrome P450 71B26-like [Durio zibethinus]|uniref:Cytochrome P450 71B26-like n=1 Tax=Durio zibethinus TaxID=66656 RepID=A0A6P5ZW13_DURZI|nr:cytochrome P450 71B26-like [Durio zibethinus]